MKYKLVNVIEGQRNSGKSTELIKRVIEASKGGKCFVTAAYSSGIDSLKKKLLTSKEFNTNIVFLNFQESEVSLARKIVDNSPLFMDEAEFSTSFFKRLMRSEFEWSSITITRTIGKDDSQRRYYNE